MSTLTIRKVDADVKRRLQMRAAENGRSMEAEVRAILGDAVLETSSNDVSFGEVMEEFRRRTGGVDLDLPARNETDDSDRRIPDFS
ncbi:hypothetical protein N798_08535 [Knoellia flava TL1]|uniref:Plasmid stability protein n=2 Tax=Knoellia flava TaxID=913969 RepID=A0A8H9FSY2_9MICO|nr:Arc family DNA-binding protein [Knoellia flava]KGN31566.1 hypothetical protein N798_08535 [Knoellia flava TL1]GGB68120.1 plasmid stability protein [Knoellia flava]